MNERRQIAKYLVADLIAAMLAWTILFVYRKTILEPARFGDDVKLEFDSNYILGLMAIPVFWILLYYVGGQYVRIFRRHRLKELGQVAITSLVGVLIIFFVLLLDDQIKHYRNYYETLLVLFCSHFVLTLSNDSFSPPHRVTGSSR